MINGDDPQIHLFSERLIKNENFNIKNFNT